MDKNRTWVYCRVAHSCQNDEALLEGQRFLLESYARERGYEIIGASCDISSGLAFDRPGLLAFWETVNKGTVDGLLLLNLARLGRDMDQVFRCWQILRERGVHIHTIAEGEIDMSIYTMLPELAEK